MGPKPGEKLFEELFTDIEGSRTFKYEDMYVILPDCLDKESNKHKHLQSFYNDNQPIGTALISDSEIAKKVDAKILVSGLMNDT